MPVTNTPTGILQCRQLADRQGQQGSTAHIWHGYTLARDTHSSPKANLPKLKPAEKCSNRKRLKRTNLFLWSWLISWGEHVSLLLNCPDHSMSV